MKYALRECPACHLKRMFPKSHNDCGCIAAAAPKEVKTAPAAAPRIAEEIKQTKDSKTISLPRTRIHTLEQLIEAFEIDLTVWEVIEFTARKWEMGYIQRERKTVHPKSEDGTQESEKDNEAGHEELYAVSAKLKKVITSEDNSGYQKENVRLMKEIKQVRFQLTAEKKYRVQLLQNSAGMDEALKQIRDIVGELGQTKVQPFEIKQIPLAFSLPIKDTHTEDAVLLLSDWHCGDVIRPGDTSGFPEFDLPICGNRIGYNIKKAKAILTMHRAMYPIKKLYVWFGGDMGNGDLHDAPVSNALFIGPQVDFTFKMAKFAIEDLMTLTVPDPETGIRVVEEIVLLFTCGNHMRESTAKYMPMKYQAQRTFDWLIYQMLIEWFNSTPRITVKQSMSPYVFEEIRGHRYGFAHGMQVGYRNSPDTQAKTMDAFLKTVRSLFDSPEFRRKNGLEGATFSRFCIGDIHVPVRFPRLISNGSMNGQNELGVNWGLEPIPAGQQLFGVTEKHLESWAYFIECSQIQKDPDDWNQYGHFAAEYERVHGRK